jgi:protein SCO1/2
VRSLGATASAFICAVLLVGAAALPSATAAAREGAPRADALDERGALALSQAAVGRVVRDAAFTASDGRRVRLADYRGKPVVVSFVYTSCPDVCPATTQHLARVAAAARAVLGERSFTVLTIGFDAVRDTPAVMRSFARAQGVEQAGWEFLSADAPTIERLAHDLGFRFERSPKGFDHMVQASVLDDAGRVYRQVYGMGFEMPQLIEPLKELVYRTPADAPLLTHLGNRVRLYCTVYDPAAGRYRFDYSLFVGIAIGALSLGSLGYLLVREWRRAVRAPRNERRPA